MNIQLGERQVSLNALARLLGKDAATVKVAVLKHARCEAGAYCIDHDDVEPLIDFCRNHNFNSQGYRAWLGMEISP